MLGDPLLENRWGKVGEKNLVKQATIDFYNGPTKAKKIEIRFIDPTTSCNCCEIGSKLQTWYARFATWTLGATKTLFMPKEVVVEAAVKVLQ